jgi:adenosylmethionine-8-amino-7-oxononanoate aminotransferase
MKTAGMPLRVVYGDGAFLHLDDGRKIIDCISSWWVTLHGHGNKRIADAIYEQAQKLEQVIFAGFTHEPAEKLAKALLEVLPKTLTRVFFSDNGSTSVEVALKMAFQYWRNVGQPERTRFIGFEGGYHGDTMGAMSAGGSSSFWQHFRKLMFDIDVVPFPETWDGDPDVDAKEDASIKALRTLLASNCTGGRQPAYAGIIIEPLVQGAAGMRMCRPEYLRKLRAIADEFSVLLIFDEVMTGFGRTGDWFASTKAGVSPDIICLSKGITGGFLPLSVTVCAERIYDAFLSDKLEQALFHSHSYTANPIACAAANASMRLLIQNQSLFRNMEATHRRLAQQHLSDSKLLTHFRYCGTIAAFDLAQAETSYYSALPQKLRAQFLEQGLLLRPLGNTIYLLPPYCIDAETLDSVYKTIRNTIDALIAELNADSERSLLCC